MEERTVESRERAEELSRELERDSRRYPGEFLEVQE